MLQLLLINNALEQTIYLGGSLLETSQCSIFFLWVQGARPQDRTSQCSSSLISKGI